MTIDEMFEAFYSVVSKGNGKEITEMFNEELNKARGDESKLRFLYMSMRKHRVNKMEYENKDIFKHLERIVYDELRMIKDYEE